MNFNYDLSIRSFSKNENIVRNYKARASQNLSPKIAKVEKFFYPVTKRKNRITCWSRSWMKQQFFEQLYLHKMSRNRRFSFSSLYHIFFRRGNLFMTHSYSFSCSFVFQIGSRWCSRFDKNSAVMRCNNCMVKIDVETLN